MPVLNEPYQHRACLACGKRIPRWTDGKATPASRLFCCNACGNPYRRRVKGRVTKGVAQNVKKRPINRAPFESVCVTELARNIRPARLAADPTCAHRRPNSSAPPAAPNMSRCRRASRMANGSSLPGRWTIAMVAASPLRRASHRDF
jgi:hypothetical protein